MNEMVKLSKKDRQDRILTELRVSTTIRISDLAAELGVSYETIRRDLEEMGQSGLINRTYGGAVVRPFGFEPAWNERFNAMTEERERIAATAASLIEQREVLMIDAGSTTLHFARRLAAEAKNLTIVTNCFAVAMAFSTNPTITVLACPGDRRDTDIRELGRLCAGLDHAIVKDDTDLRGREPGEVPALIASGLAAGGMPADRIETVLAEVEAIDHALRIATEHDVVVVLADRVGAVLAHVQRMAAHRDATG